MALNLKMADAAVNAEATSLSVLLNAGKLEIWDGSQPANADATSGVSVLGVSLVLANPAFGAAAAGVITANTIPAVTAVASITATWARFRTASNVCIMDGTVGVSAGATVFDVRLNSVAISSGALVTISSVVHTVTK